MIIGRRRLFLALSFLCLTVAFTNGLVRAQSPGPRQGSGPRLMPMGGVPPHEVWGANLTPDQLKAALTRLGQGEVGPEMSPFQEMLKDFILKQDPKLDPNDPQIQQALKNIIGNKDLMDKLQAMAKQKQGESGGPSKLSQEDLAKLFKSKLPDRIKTPAVPPPNVPPQNNPNLPNLPPDFKFPPNPKQGGNPNGAVNPMPMGEGQPNFPNPIDPGNPLNMGKGNPLLPDTNPFGQPDEPTDPRSKSMAALAAMWERNVGPLDDTPEVKRALFDLALGENGFDFDLKDDNGNSIWDFLKNGSGDNSPLTDTLMNGDGGDWKLPKFDLPTIGWSNWFGNSRSSSNGGSSGSSHKPPPDPSSGSGSGGFGSFGGIGGLNGFWWSVVLGVVVLGALLLWWRYLRDSDAAAGGHVGNNLGPWPVDPRAINTRDDLVKAFEYLSVLICGPAAKMWTHGTIAEALTELAVSHGEPAVKLARLYELARYAPLDEPLSRHELIEARHLVCDLAGVS